MLCKKIFLASVAVCVLASPGIAGPLARDEAVKRFLGIGLGSGAKVAAVKEEGRDVVVVGLELPLGAAGDAKGDPAGGLKVKELRFLDVVTGEATARFAGVNAIEVVVTGQEGVAVKTMAVGPLEAINLGTAPFSVDGDFNATMLGVVSSSSAGVIRAESYSVAYRSDGSEKFTQTLKVEGLQVRDMGQGNHRARGEVKVTGDRLAKTVDAEIRIGEPQFGEVTGKVSLVGADVGRDRVSMAVGQNLVGANPEIKAGSLTFVPSESVRMMVSFLPSEKRDELVKGLEPVVGKALGLTGGALSEANKAFRSFLANPSALTLTMSPVSPVPLKSLFGGVGASSADERAANWGVRIAVGE